MALEGFDEFTAGVGGLSFENAYDMGMDDLMLLAALFVCSFVFSALLSAIVKMLYKPKVESTEWVQITPESASDAASSGGPEPEEELSPQEKLRRREDDLKRRDSAIKAERMRELSEREKYVKMKEQPVEPAGQQADDHGSGADSIEGDRARIKKLLDEAERRFSAGELTEKNFRTIAEDYQRQLIELDVRMKRKRPGGF